MERKKQVNSCSTCGVKHNSLLSCLSHEESGAMDVLKSCSTYKKGQSIFLEGSYPRGVYCMNAGKVKIFQRGEDGKEQIIHLSKAGEMLGFRAMFSGEPYSVSAEALEDTSVCFIDKNDFLDLIDQNVTLRNSILKEFSKELNVRAKHITNMAQKSVRERLAFSLVLLHEIYDQDAINLSREDLANFVGTATETLIRLLKEFKEDGYIDTDVRKIFIKDLSSLLNLAGN